tara:strand:+ start:438 stop:746 length:309 start_codon:yes stop_codon:yes gene_type:complete
MDYSVIYKAQNSFEANFIKGLLKEYSINCKLLGESLSIGIGELPVDVMQVEVLVENKDLKKSNKIMQDYKNNLTNINQNERNCPKCHQSIPTTFKSCWNCNQ